MKARLLVAGIFVSILAVANGSASEEPTLRESHQAAPACLGLETSSFALPVETDEGPPVCAWASEKPCPTAGDCGYDWDGVCCTPRCERPFGCLGFCYFGSNVDLPDSLETVPEEQ